MKKRIIVLAHMYDLHPTAIWSSIRRRIFPHTVSEDGVLLVEEDDPLFQAWVKQLAKGRQEKDEWTLTERERQVYELLALDFLTQQDIADDLEITVHTVYFHAKHIYEKIGVRGRIGLRRVAREKAGQADNEE